MSDVEITHVGYEDESNWNKGRFRSLANLTLLRTMSKNTQYNE